jgi:sugar phosphate permease
MALFGLLGFLVYAPVAFSGVMSLDFTNKKAVGTATGLVGFFGYFGRVLQAKGIGCNDYFTPIHLQPIYQELGYHEGDFPITEAVGARTLALPFYNRLGPAEIDYIVQQLKELL